MLRSILSTRRISPPLLRAALGGRHTRIQPRTRTLSISPRCHQRIGGVANTFFHMELPNSRPYVAFALTFSKPLDSKSVLQELNNLVSQNPRLRQISAGGSAFRTPSWVDDQNFDLHHHLHTPTLPPSTSAIDHLQKYSSEWMPSPFPPDRPLWDVHVLQGKAEGGGVIFMRAHHAIGDGQAFMLAFERLSAHSASSSVLSDTPSPIQTPPFPRPIPPIISGRPIALSQSLFRSPASLLPSLQSIIRGIQAISTTIGNIATFQRKSLLYPQERTQERNVLWADIASFDQINRIRRNLPRTTINDVLTTGISQAMTRVLVRRKEIHDKELLFLIPISLRHPGDTSFSNHVAFDLLTLTNQEMSHHQALSLVHQRMKVLKALWFPRAFEFLAKHVFAFPVLFPARSLLATTDLCHAVYSNVPGPRSLIYFAGQRVDRIYALPPSPSKGSISMASVSYNGKFSLALVGDRIPQHENLIQEVHAAVCVQLDQMDQGERGDTISSTAL